MVIRITPRRRQRGMLIAEMMVAMAILVIAVLPLGYAFNSDARMLKITYQQSVAMEIVDGEIEILAAGAWRDQPEGSLPYPVHANAATNLPPGQFLLTRTANHLRLQWSSTKPSGISKIVREVDAK
jgi:hypothetical protein